MIAVFKLFLFVACDVKSVDDEAVVVVVVKELSAVHYFDCADFRFDAIIRVAY